MTAGRPPWDADAARTILSVGEEPGAVLVSLQALQGVFGYVHPDAVPLVAQALNVSRADVYGVLTFYRDLRTTPPADVEVRVCLGEACQAVGARDLHEAALCLVEATCDVQHVFCLGNCALGPTAVVNDRLIGRVDTGRLEDAIEAARSSA